MTGTRSLSLLPNHAVWADQLKAVGRQPLTLCPEFPRVAMRFEAWWHQQVLDRPIWMAVANQRPELPITRRIDLVNQPELWLESKLRDLYQTVWFGDAIPNIRVDFGAACLGAMIGGPVEFSSDTTWTHACIHSDDWSDAPPWKLDNQGKWWKRLQILLDVASEAAKGRFLVCTPSFGGLADVLTNLRGATEICMDMLEHPDRIVNSMKELQPVWRAGFCELYDRVLMHGAGLFHWHLIWSELPYVITECDLGFSIGPAEFRHVCLPDIELTAQSVGRSIFHLDGAGSTRHLEALLEVPEVRAIQYTPGAGSPSAMAWLRMFKRIQEKGRSLLIFAPADEVIPLMRNLKPEGLAIMVEGAVDLGQLQEIERALS